MKPKIFSYFHSIKNLVPFPSSLSTESFIPWNSSIIFFAIESPSPYPLPCEREVSAFQSLSKIWGRSDFLIPIPVSWISIHIWVTRMSIRPSGGVNFCAFDMILPIAVKKSSGVILFETFSPLSIWIRESMPSNLVKMRFHISVICISLFSFRAKKRSESTTHESSFIIFFALVIPCSLCSVWIARSRELSSAKSLFLISWAISSENCSSLSPSFLTRVKRDSRERARITTSSFLCHFTLTSWESVLFQRENFSDTSFIRRIGESIYHEKK